MSTKPHEPAWIQQEPYKSWRKNQALRDEAWMINFLTAAFTTEAVFARREVHAFGNQDTTAAYRACGHIVAAVENLSRPWPPAPVHSEKEMDELLGARENHLNLVIAEAGLRRMSEQQLSSWLFETISKNDTDRCKALRELLSARKRGAAKFVVKPTPTFNACVLAALENLIPKAAIATETHFEVLGLGTAHTVGVRSGGILENLPPRDGDRFRRWWELAGKTCFLPQHLPNSGDLHAAALKLFRESRASISTNDKHKEFAEALKVFGLSGLKEKQDE